MSRRRSIARKDCANPACTDAPIPGRRFCPEHAVQLDRMRVEFEEDGRARRHDAFGRTKRRRGSKVPICCTVGCFNERIAGEAFCANCQMAGATEEGE